MKGWILDTNVLSELRRKHIDRSVEGWMMATGLESLFTTSVNIVELRVGIANHPSAADAHRLTIWLEDTIRPWFKEKILGVSEESLFIWRKLSREREKKQLPAPVVDLLIAAIALAGNFGVATRDTKPFKGIDVPVLNPWTGERFNGV